MGDSVERYLTLCSLLVATYFSQNFFRRFQEEFLKITIEKFLEEKEKGKSFGKEVWKVGTNKKPKQLYFPPEKKRTRQSLQSYPYFLVACAVKKGRISFRRGRAKDEGIPSSSPTLDPPPPCPAFPPSAINSILYGKLLSIGGRGGENSVCSGPIGFWTKGHAP